VLRFRDALAAGDLELAARLYAGDLLPACYDDWVLDERAKLRAEAYGALMRLTEEAAGYDDHKATIRYAQRIIDLEPTDEVAVRIQMEAHLALGNRAAALRAYHRFAEVLERELAVAPGEAIGAMYQRLRADHDEVQGDAQGEDLAAVAESPFVGRDFELKQLNEAWNTARKGSERPVSHRNSAAAFKQRDTWWLRLVRTRLRADCPGVLWSTSSDQRLSGATSTRSTRSGGPNSLVSCPNSTTLPGHLDGASRATWLIANGCSML
jgi:hypothetical protein